jgi:hypothetical protein
MKAEKTAMKKLSLLLTFVLGIILAGCGSSAPPPIAIALSPATTQAIDDGQSVNVMATVSNDALSKGVSWSLSGAGTLSGQTAAAVTYAAPASGPAANATITATSVTDATKSASLMVAVTPLPAITTTTLPAGTEGTAYNQTIAETGGAGALSFALANGSTLPPGLTLGSGGAITGTPTGPNGTTNFTVQLTDSSTAGAKSATQALSIVINLPPPPSITTTTLPAGVEGTAYNQTIQATGGLTPYTFTISSVTGLPAGLSLNSSTGVISGKPAGPSGASNFTVTVTDKSNPAQTASKNLSIAINLPPPPTIAPTSLPNGNVGTPYNQTLTVSAGLGPNYTWTVSSGTLPAGLTLTGNNSTATVTGTPTTQQTNVGFTVQVTDSSVPPQTGTQNYTVTINPPMPLNVTTTSGSLPQGTLNSAYPATNLSASGGIQPYTWTVTSLPATFPTGLALSGSGQITGTPTTANTYNFTVQVKDSVNTTATANLSIVVNAAPCAGYGTGNEAVLNGQYAFLFQGFNGSAATNPFAAVGSFAADGTGKVTAGDVDFNLPSAPQHLVVAATGSSYKIGNDNRGCMVLSIGTTPVAMHFAVGGISAGVASKGRVIEFDDTDGTGTRGSGILRLQTKTDFLASRLNARYAFGLDGFDSTSGHVAIGGAFATGGSGTTITNGYTDVDDAGTLQPGLTGATGTIGAISATTGRAAVSYNAGAIATYNWVIYVVNANEVFVVSSDALAANKPVVSGRAIVTGSSFSNATLNGNYIIHVNGISGGLANANIGLLNFNAGSLTGTLWEYSLGRTPNAKVNPITAGTYAVNATSGRAPLTGTGNYPPVLYLTTPTDGISAFIIGTDNSGIFGLAESQPTATYSTNSLSGNGGKFFFGNEDPGDNTVKDEVGTVTITPATGAISGLQDSSQGSSPFLQTGKAVSGTFVINSDGTGNLGANSVLLTNGTKVVFIDEGAGRPAKITVVEQ